jgi:hypothetical protein
VICVVERPRKERKNVNVDDVVRAHTGVLSGKELYDYERLRAESVIPAVDRIETYAALNDA